MRILIVEDDFTNRVVLQKYLSAYGECDIAVNGEEAVQAHQLALDEANPYQLICLDIMMPTLDGNEALKIIRDKEKLLNVSPEKEVKIIMVTALDSPHDVFDSYYSGGCTSYLIKPIQKSTLIAQLKDLKLISD